MSDYIVGIDLETTGLLPKAGRILEVAVAIWHTSNTDSNPVDAFTCTCYESPRTRPLYDISALKMHVSSGLLELVENPETLEVSEVRVNLLEWLQDRFRYHQILNPYMFGSSVHFDRAWLKYHMPEIEQMFHYRNLDVTSVTKFLADQGYTFKRQKSEHRALPDIIQTYTRYMECMEHVRKLNVT